LHSFLNPVSPLSQPSRYSLSTPLSDALQVPYFVGLSSDSLLNGLTRYAFSPGKTTVGRQDAPTVINMTLGGAGVAMHHCDIVNSGGVLSIKATSSVTVNGREVFDAVVHHGDVVVIGSAHAFVCWNREELESRQGSKVEEVRKAAEVSSTAPAEKKPRSPIKAFTF